MARLKKWAPGNFLRINLDKDGYTFAQIIDDPLVAFYDFLSKTPNVPIEEIADKPIAFSIWIMNSAIGRAGWSVIGNLPLRPELVHDYFFFKQDSISGKLSVYTHFIYDYDPDKRIAAERPATYEEAKHLECAAVWSRCHVEERLTKHFHGLPEIPVDLRPEKF